MFVDHVVRIVTHVRDLHLRGIIWAFLQFAKNFCNNFRRKYLSFLSLACRVTVLPSMRRCVLKGTQRVSSCLETSCNFNPKQIKSTSLSFRLWCKQHRIKYICEFFCPKSLCVLLFRRLVCNEHECFKNYIWWVFWQIF